jgi:site-specific recombinase XerD
VASDRTDDEGSEAVAAWSAGLTARSGETARSYRTAVQRFLTTVDTPVSEASLADVLFYVRDLSRSGLARATLAQHVSAIRSFLRYCQATEVSPAMPLDLLRRPRVLITSMNRYLTQDEASLCGSSAKRSAVRLTSRRYHFASDALDVAQNDARGFRQSTTLRLHEAHATLRCA